MKRRVALVEFPIYQQFPLVSGYLQAYASADPVVADAFEFVRYQEEIERTTHAKTLAAIRQLNCSIICFSCYVWNMGLVKRLVRDFQQDSTVERIILGGHQVSHQIAQYVGRDDGKTIVINGQGEIPFRSVMQRVAGGVELAGSRGVSLFADGDLWNGGEAEMLKDLDQIPSPFLNGLFDRLVYPMTIFETNRGCPYQCTFCTWGGYTRTVTKFSIDRIKAELRWIAKKAVMFIFLADANWGMLRRDTEISEYVARLKGELGFPRMLFYAAAKNKPKRSVSCIGQLHDGGVITSQAIGIQSLNPTTLSLIHRENVRNSAFVDMFVELKARDIDSYCELIWPLPGETLDTLKAGFEQLVELGAQTIIVYPAILINNARLTDQVAEFEIEACPSDDWRSELKLVKKTKFADRSAVDDGFWFYYSFFLIGNCDASKALLRHVRETTGMRYSDVIAQFAQYLRDHLHTSAYGQLVARLFREEAHGSVMTIGRLAVHALHEQRASAQMDVARFMLAKLAPLDADRSLAVSTLWALTLPRLFGDTTDDPEGLVERFDRLAELNGRCLSNLVRIRTAGRTVVLEPLDAEDAWRSAVMCFAKRHDSSAIDRIEITHPSGRMVYYDAHDAKRNFVYAHGMIQRLGHIAPSARVCGRSAVDMACAATGNSG